MVCTYAYVAVAADNFQLDTLDKLKEFDLSTLFRSQAVLH